MREWVFGDWEVEDGRLGRCIDVGVSEAYSMVAKSHTGGLDLAHEVMAEA